MDSTSSSKTPWLFLFLIGALLFLSGYYFGLPKGSMVAKEIADQSISQADSIGKRDKAKSKQSPSSNSVKSYESPQVLEDIEESNNIPTIASLEELLISAQSESNPIRRSAALARAFETLNQDNIGEALKAFETLPMGFENAQEYKMLLYAWAQFDPLAAVDYCKSRASGIGAGFATAGVLEGWASRDPNAAREWVENPENAGMAKLYNFGLVKGWASRDLEGATAYVTGLKGGDEVGKLVGILTDQHNRQGGFNKASSWAEALPDPKLKEGAFMNLSRSYARDRPQEVGVWLEAHANEKYSAKAFENLGKRWSETDPQSSIDYFSNLPEGKSQEVGIKSSISNWAKKDPLAAGDWLNEKESGPQLDSALAAYANTVSIKDGGGAMEWAISISDEKLQQSTIKKVGQEWYRQDKESVEAWLPTSGLSEGAQKSISNPPKKNWWQSLHEE